MKGGQNCCKAVLIKATNLSLQHAHTFGDGGGRGYDNSILLHLGNT